MIRLIAAIDRRRGIAKHHFRPWYIPDDQAYFAKMTKTNGGILLVGATTFATAFRSKPLEDRTMYVLSSKEQAIDGVEVVSNLHEWLEKLANQDVWIVGGESVYEQIMNADKADELYITDIDADFGCDQFFPEYEAKFHVEDKSEDLEQNGFRFNYLRLTRNT